MEAPKSLTSEYAYQLKWPNWLRWALLLPTVVVGRFVIAVVAVYMLDFSGAYNPGSPEEAEGYGLIKAFLATLIGSYAALIVAAKLAPRHHVRTTTVLALASGTLDVAFLVAKYPEVSWVNWVGFAAMAFGFLVAHIEVERDVRKYTPEGRL